MKLKLIIFSLVLSIILLGIVYLLWGNLGQTTKSHHIKGLLWPHPQPLTDFQLTHHQGYSFTLDNLKGKWNWLFFGYTHCPDICPVTLSLLRDVKRQLAHYAKYATNTQYIFISVDGHRDTPKKLAEYVHYFDPNFIGVTGTPAQVNTLTRQLGIVYIRQPEISPGHYFIDHSSLIILVDPQGEMVGQFTAPHTVETVVNRYLKIRQFLKEHL